MTDVGRVIVADKTICEIIGIVDKRHETVYEYFKRQSAVSHLRFFSNRIDNLIDIRIRLENETFGRIYGTCAQFVCIDYTENGIQELFDVLGFDSVDEFFLFLFGPCVIFQTYTERSDESFRVHSIEFIDITDCPCDFVRQCDMVKDVSERQPFLRIFRIFYT